MTADELDRLITEMRERIRRDAEQMYNMGGMGDPLADDLLRYEEQLRRDREHFGGNPRRSRSVFEEIYDQAARRSRSVFEEIYDQAARAREQSGQKAGPEWRGRDAYAAHDIPRDAGWEHSHNAGGGSDELKATQRAQRRQQYRTAARSVSALASFARGATQAMRTGPGERTFEVYGEAGVGLVMRNPGGKVCVGVDHVGTVTATRTSCGLVFTYAEIPA